MKRENVSLRALQNRLHTEGKNSPARCIENWFKKHDLRIKECKALRNTYIDHLDADQHLMTAVYVGTTPQRIFMLVDATFALLNRLAMELGENHRNFYDAGFMYGGKGLMVMLRESDIFKRLKSNILNSKTTLEDIKLQIKEDL